MSNIFIEGEMINLCPIEKRTAPVMAKWMNDPSIRVTLIRYLPVSTQMEEVWISSLEENPNKNVVLAITLKERGEHIGNVGLHSINWKNRVATLGIVIGNKKHWGNGIGTEAIKLILQYAFRTLNLRKINSVVVEGNKGSLIIHDRNGFKVEGAHKKEHFIDGEYRDLILLGVFRSDCKKAQKK